ncbi:peptidoglycan-binding domain-containing protein [Streptomyces adustus]|uniref:peptidoglycan-binding domain-containing protein n=1 Tax=Streptomyces adustus TaxID=1609272 RepID=UPI003724BFE2
MNNISRKTRYRVTALAVAALAFGVVAGPAATAQAATAQGYVDGWDYYKDDWADEGLLSTTQHANSGATGLWQLVLWQDGYLSESDVDCQFGPRTQAATKKWQAHYLGAAEADGVVGNKTFGEAGRHIWSTDDGFSLRYGNVYIGRNVNNGGYFFQTGYTNGFVQASYTSAANCR